MSKKEKYGSYVRKVGNYDIRQKIKMPVTKRDKVGGNSTTAGSVEISLYHGKKLIEGGFKSHDSAAAKAKELQDIK